MKNIYLLEEADHVYVFTDNLNKSIISFLRCYRPGYVIDNDVKFVVFDPEGYEALEKAWPEFYAEPEKYDRTDVSISVYKWAQDYYASRGMWRR